VQSRGDESPCSHEQSPGQTHDRWAELEDQLANLSYKLKRAWQSWAKLPAHCVPSPHRTPRIAVRVKTAWAVEGVARLIAGYEPASSVKLIPERFGISKASVLKLLVEEDVTTRKSGVNYDYLPDQLRLSARGQQARCLWSRLIERTAEPWRVIFDSSGSRIQIVRQSQLAFMTRLKRLTPVMHGGI
jgi:hypothetical protein